MALVAHSGLPAFTRMRDEGVKVVAPGEIDPVASPRLTIGLLNLMPDAALAATDRQFMRLLSSYADRADLWVYPFTVASGSRGDRARRHIDDHYATFAELQQMGLDALIVTGANPVHHDLEREVFWKEMGEVFEWAAGNTHSVLCSCLATHAVLKRDRSIERTRLPRKRWGLYSHRLVTEAHPLVTGLGSSIDAPHSHWYDVTRPEMESAGLTVLIESDEAGVHMAVSEDDFYVFFQGHPEYEPVSLLKEYKREIGRFHRDERPDYPPYPEHYFDDEALELLEEHRQQVVSAKKKRLPLPPLAEDPVLPRRANTWGRAGNVIYGNWLTDILSRKQG